MEPIYTRWNACLNLISRQDISNLYIRHVLHALSIAKVVSLRPGAQLLDVGTGGGFPGIPLAIVFPQVHFHLIDSIAKKIKAVDSIYQELGLSNVSTEVIRAEKVNGKYEFILGRGVKNLVTFRAWVRHAISPYTRHEMSNGILYLKGNEPVDPTLSCTTYALKDTFPMLPFFRDKQLVHVV